MTLIDTETAQDTPESFVADSAPMSRLEILGRLRALKKADDRAGLLQYQVALETCELVGDLKVCVDDNGELLSTTQFLADADAVGVGRTRANLIIKHRIYEKRAEIEAEVKAAREIHNDSAGSFPYPRLQDMITRYSKRPQAERAARQARPAANMITEDAEPADTAPDNSDLRQRVADLEAQCERLQAERDVALAECERLNGLLAAGIVLPETHGLIVSTKPETVARRARTEAKKGRPRARSVENVAGAKSRGRSGVKQTFPRKQKSSARRQTHRGVDQVV
jgi:hypothetical protein